MDEAKHLHEPGGDFQCLHEFIPAARKKLSDHIWGYLVGATETETTLRRNRMAIDSLALRPRICVDVSKIDTSTTLFGKKWRMPAFLSPVGSLESFDAGGAATAGRAASAFGVPIMCSSVTHPGLEEIAAATPGPKIFQLYVRGDDAWVDDVVKPTAMTPSPSPSTPPPIPAGNATSPAAS
jgi:isopentenyl diphosphate isomerase/L-lactate dehydrogenase-like FMN-dependent dehydrogenase